eukprot:1122046-Pleurochrysis_carterae.AAC.1
MESAASVYATILSAGVTPAMCGKADALEEDRWSAQDMDGRTDSDELRSCSGEDADPIQDHTSAPDASNKGLIVLLTRDEHRDSAWVADLRFELLEYGADVRVLQLSEVETSGNWRCLVNRVSDAAPPQDVKICLAALRGAELAGIPVVNGTSAYSLCSSKLLHYALFHRVGVSTPPYAVLRRGLSPEVVRSCSFPSSACCRFHNCGCNFAFPSLSYRRP